MEAAHCLPVTNRVVGDVLLVDVAVAGEELRGIWVDHLPHGQIVQYGPDNGVDARAFLRIDVDMREG